jgi:LysR family transcriptional regulator, regulator for bpeEF and oprC
MMLDLNSLQMFEKVASLKSFTAAARALGLTKSKVSRSVAKLERSLGTRLFQRTTRDVVPTPGGSALRDRSAAIVSNLKEALDYVGGLGGQPSGTLKISAGIGIGINVLAEQLPESCAAIRRSGSNSISTAAPPTSWRRWSISPCASVPYPLPGWWR